MSAGPWSSGDARAQLALPALAVDSHLHIYDARFPFDPRADLRPADATVDDYRQLQARLGTSRCVVVQPSSYGSDNRCLVDALAQLGATARGVAVVDDAVSDAELKALNQAGVRGIRFNFARPAGPSADSLETLARRIAPLGWHVQLHAVGNGWLQLASAIGRLPVPVVIDHLGRLPNPPGTSHPAWRMLASLVESGRAWVKLSGAYHDSLHGPPGYEDTAGIARSWLRLAPERLVWGTDWPHPGAVAAGRPLPDDAALLDLLPNWAGSASLVRQVMVENPSALYGFTPPA